LRNVNRIFVSGILNQPPKRTAAEGVIQMEFLLKLMRMGHTILGITAPPPEHERAYLLGWILSLILVFAFSIGLVLFLVPRVMR
jgi:hypothetical protein